MENAVDALKIAFGVFVLTMALSIGMYMFNQAKATADVVLASSDTETYAMYTNAIEGIASIDGDGDRIVGLETIIPTLYKYYKENYTVVFLQSNGEPLTLYTTRMNNPDNWSDGFINKYRTYADDDLRVCSFDVDEETSRHEPWTGGTDYYKQNLDMFLSGGTFYAPSNNHDYDYDYGKKNGSGTNGVNGWGNGSFIDQFQDKQFRESIGQYTYSNITEDAADDPTYDSSGLTNTAPKTKRVIVYTLLN